jgi:hypothetical protein
MVSVHEDGNNKRKNTQPGSSVKEVTSEDKTKIGSIHPKTGNQANKKLPK